MTKLSLSQRLDRADGKMDGRIHWQGFEKYLRHFCGADYTSNYSRKKTQGKLNNRKNGYVQSYLTSAEIKKAANSLKISLLKKQFGVESDGKRLSGSRLETLSQSIIMVGTGGQWSKNKLNAGMTYAQFAGLQKRY